MAFSWCRSPWACCRSIRSECVALRRVSDAVFKQPVKIGDEVHVDGKITALTELGGGQGLVETSLRILNQDDRLVARLRAELVWR